MKINESIWDKNIKMTCFLTAAFSISINFVGYGFFGFEFCNNCVYQGPKDKTKNWRHFLIEVITYIDYFFPLAVAFYIIFLICKIYKHFKSNPS